MVRRSPALQLPTASLLAALLLATWLFAAWLSTACSEPPNWQPVDQPSPRQVAAKARAETARTALAAALGMELKAALKSGGAASGIEVCSRRAQAIAEEIGRAHWIKIGRTSHQLRQPSNAPPTWARSAVESATSEGEPALLSSGTKLGVLFPIRLQPQCVICHGTPDQLAPGVAKTLSEHYPTDRATGFAPGDLRGWFWVEVDE